MRLTSRLQTKHYLGFIHAKVESSRRQHKTKHIRTQARKLNKIVKVMGAYDNPIPRHDWPMAALQPYTKEMLLKSALLYMIFRAR